MEELEKLNLPAIPII